MVLGWYWNVNWFNSILERYIRWCHLKIKEINLKSLRTKKISGFNIDRFVYIFGFLSVPLFAYLIYNDVHSGILGGVLSIVGIVVLVYLISLIYTLIDLKKIIKYNLTLGISVMILKFLTVNVLKFLE